MDVIFQLQSFDNFKTVSQELLLNIHKSELISIHDIDVKMINLAKEELRKIILSHNFDIINIKETIQNKKWDEEKVNYFVSLIEEHKTQLLYLIIVYTTSKYGETLLDFNWVFKLVYGTSDSHALRFPLVQLELSTVSNGEQKQNTYDFTKEMLSKLISVMENYV